MSISTVRLNEHRADIARYNGEFSKEISLVEVLPPMFCISSNTLFITVDEIDCIDEYFSWSRLKPFFHG